MKLQAGNPNLMKKMALRVNPHATLESFTNTVGNKAHAKERTGYMPSPRDPDAVPSPEVNIWHQPVYVPENHQPARRGAENFLSIKSRGV